MTHHTRLLITVLTLAMATVAGAGAADLSREVACGATRLIDGPHSACR